MRKFFILLGLTAFVAVSCSKQDDNPIAVEKQNQLKLTNGWGHGVNIQPSYYNNGYPNLGVSLMKQQTKIKTIRIEIEPDKVTQAKSWIKELKNAGYNLICTYHKASVLGTDNTSELTAAANWWKNNYSALAANGSFTINLMNEWGSHNITADAYAKAYNSAISIVRQVYSGPIIIDAPGWGQEAAILAAAVKGYNSTKISDGNIVLSMHVYPNGWNQAKNRVINTSDIDDLASTGKPCIIGEFGNSPSGSADWSAIVDYAKSKGWTVLGWCWNGDGGSMNMVTPAWKDNPTATSFSKSSYFSVVYNKL